MLLVVLSVAAASLLVVVMVAAEAPSLWSVWGVEAVAGAREWERRRVWRVGGSCCLGC